MPCHTKSKHTVETGTKNQPWQNRQPLIAVRQERLLSGCYHT